MGLRDDIQEALTEAFDGDLSDVVVAFEYVQITKGVYDPTTGLSPKIEVVTPTRGIFDPAPWRRFRPDEDIRLTDIIVIVNGVDLVGVVPVVNDVVRTIVEDYQVKRVRKVMEESPVIIYEIQIRRVSE